MKFLAYYEDALEEIEARGWSEAIRKALKYASDHGQQLRQIRLSEGPEGAR